MLKLAVIIAALATMASPARPQAGAYPHLQLTDGLTVLVPPASGPFDNSSTFQAFAGSSFVARISYTAVGQPNQNVLWGLLVSAGKTPFSTTTVPPPLFTMPPVILLLPTPANLNALGQGIMNLFVPAGILDAQTYVQGLIYDVTASPAMKLSNGVTVDVDVPSFNVEFAWVKSTPATNDETLVSEFGAIEIGADVMPQLKPIGLLAPPLAVAGPAFYPDDVRFLPIVPNAPDEPINPLARPFTRTAATATTTDTQILVEDTSFFPTRGRLLINVSTEAGSKNLWGDKQSGGNIVPRQEIVAYDGKLPDRFLNCQRSQLGSSAGSPLLFKFTHDPGEQVLGDYTFATTSGARGRTRIGLDADNQDMPHVVIPAYTAPDGEGDEVTRDLDLYLFESKVDKVQGFAVFDRVTSTWRAIEGSTKNVQEGRWNPMVCLAPDGRSFVAELVVSGGALGWDHQPNTVFAIRTDGLDWPASDSESWQISYALEPDPTSAATDVRSRRVIMRSTAIVGPDADNYVAFIGLAHKWKFNTVTPGTFFAKNKGWEGEWVREEVLVRDYIDLPLVGPESSKAVPSMPRPYITPQFGLTGFGSAVIRFDPEVLVSPDKTRLMVTAGGGTNADEQEDVYVIRNVGINAAGQSTKVVGNVTGFSNQAQSASAEPTPIRPFSPGGHGDGRRAAFSPGGTRVAFVAKFGASNDISDWLCWANANASSFGKVKYVYDDPSITVEDFLVAGPYKNDRVIEGLRWVDENRLLFFMGKHPYDDVAGVLNESNVPQMDLFLYDIPSNVMTNLTRSSGAADDFGSLGKISPTGYMLSPNGAFAYFLRAGKQVLNGGATGPAVANLVGVNLATLQVFPVTGTEFGAGALIPNLDLPSTELLAQVECPAAMRMVEGTGIQAGMRWFTAHVQGGNGSDELFGVNLDMPFVAFQATSSDKPGLHISNVAADPWGGKVAFARTDGPDVAAPTQHPFVVDLDNFLFERDLLPQWVSGSTNLGRVMDGSFHFIPPSGSAGDALVFSFGYQAQPTGIAQVATPAYYPLAAVSDLLAEPVPIVIPLVDTVFLGTDYRFYVPHAGLAEP